MVRDRLSRAELLETARLLRALIELIRTGRLAAEGPVAGAVARRLEGAVLALEHLVRIASKKRG